MKLTSFSKHAGCVIFSAIIPQSWQNNLVGSSHPLHLLCTSRSELQILHGLFSTSILRKYGIKKV